VDIVLVLTFAWAYAFSRIYLRPETRVAASEWIYQNVPGPVDLQGKLRQGLLFSSRAFPGRQPGRAKFPLSSRFLRRSLTRY